MRRMLALTLIALAGLGCSTAIQHGLDETAANEVLTSLERAGIAASKRRDEGGAFSVRVAAGDAVSALELLRSLGLPREPRARAWRARLPAPRRGGSPVAPATGTTVIRGFLASYRSTAVASTGLAPASPTPLSTRPPRPASGVADTTG